MPKALYEKRGSLAYVTLNRPEARNAVDLEMHELLWEIWRDDQWAIRSAKETILDVIGRPLDDQLALEAVYGYSGAANPAIPERLRHFYDKTDPGRAGQHTTPVD